MGRAPRAGGKCEKTPVMSVAKKTDAPGMTAANAAASVSAETIAERIPSAMAMSPPRSGMPPVARMVLMSPAFRNATRPRASATMPRVWSGTTGTPLPRKIPARRVVSSRIALVVAAIPRQLAGMIPAPGMRERCASGWPNEPPPWRRTILVFGFFRRKFPRTRAMARTRAVSTAGVSPCLFVMTLPPSFKMMVRAMSHTLRPSAGASRRGVRMQRVAPASITGYSVWVYVGVLQRKTQPQSFHQGPWGAVPHQPLEDRAFHELSPLLLYGLAARGVAAARVSVQPQQRGGQALEEIGRASCRER